VRRLGWQYFFVIRQKRHWAKTALGELRLGEK